MPWIKIQHVCSSSSEDPNQPAENLLSLESYKKWRCASVAEKKAVVVLQLEKSSQIHSLDIGNNGSAFVEVLVGRSTSPEQYEVLLGMSTFMSPVESKQWSSATRVRMFGKEKFSKEVAAQKWDRVKLVCTQPYNKSEKYGLSFIKLHSPPDPESETAGPALDSTPSNKDPTQSKLGAFSLKGEVKNLSPGSLFFKRKAPSPSPSPNAAAQARMASSVALRDEPAPPRDPVGTVASEAQSSQVAASTNNGAGGSRKRNAPDSGNVGISGAEKKKKKGGKGTDNGGGGSGVSSGTGGGSGSGGGTGGGGVSSGTGGGGGGGGDGGRAMPLSKILDGVVFVLSGFKNPFRGKLREKGVEMGGVYQADWDPSCTHLVCAFSNTPKFNQVKDQGGLIVRKEWILDSHAEKKRYPSKKYRLSSGSANLSEDERYDEKEAAIFGQCVTTPSHNEQGSDRKIPSISSEDSVGEEDPYGASTDEDQGYELSTDEGEVDPDEIVKSKLPPPPPPPPPAPHEDSSECDTEEEIERIRQRQSVETNRPKHIKDKDRNDSSTDEDPTPTSRPHPNLLPGLFLVVSDIMYFFLVTPSLPPPDTSSKPQPANPPSSKSLLDLPDFLSQCDFFLYGEFAPSDRRLLVRYISAYGGQLSGYMSDKVTHVLTQLNWDENFDQALTDNSRLAFVRPNWIFACHQKQKCVPHQTYEVPPG